MELDRFITDRVRGIDASGIRRVFDLAATLDDPINLSIGQPDFDVPEPIRQAAVAAVQNGFNRYTQTQGVASLRDKIGRRLAAQFPDTLAAAGGDALRDDLELLITSGVSGALLLSLLTCVGPGDEVLVPDPSFVMYRHLVRLAGATPVYVDTYPDFQLTPERIEPHITDRTKLLLFNSPSNPTGVVASAELCRQIAELCDRRGIVLLSDEIYDEFCYEKQAACEPAPAARGLAHAPDMAAKAATPKIPTPRTATPPRCPSPVSYNPNVLLMRGFSKTYAMTGWRLGYAAGPKAIIEQMTKLQQYSFVCAPSTAQLAGVEALEVDMTEQVEAYRRKRDRVVERLSPHYELATPGGAFYAFPKVPDHLGLTASQFVEKAIARKLLIIPGSVFSRRDTHFRLSYACNDQMLDRGLDALVQLARQPLAA